MGVVVRGAIGLIGTMVTRRLRSGGDEVVALSRDRGRSRSSLSFAAVYGELDELATRARSRGAGRVEGPVDTPWNTRDLTTIDPDGNVVIFTAARPPEHADAAFTDQMRRWSAEQYITTG